MTTEMMNWMKKSINIAIVVLAFLGISACQSHRKCNHPGETGTSALQVEIDSLKSRTLELEEKNAAQEQRIKDLEEDLDRVISFLGNELGY